MEKELIQLAMRDAGVKACWMHFKAGHCSKEEMLTAMVLMLAKQKDAALQSASDYLLHERVVYIVNKP